MRILTPRLSNDLIITLSVYGNYIHTLFLLEICPVEFLRVFCAW